MRRREPFSAVVPLASPGGATNCGIPENRREFRSCAKCRGISGPRRDNPGVARSVRRSPRLDVGADVAAVLRDEEAARLEELRDLDRLRCARCGKWIEPDSDARTSVSISIDGGYVAVEFNHLDCAPSRADLRELVIHAQAEPLGIEYAQALHPEAGPVLVWERKLDLRVRGLDGLEQYLYLDNDWWEGFHPPLADEPVRLLVGWLLRPDEEDLLLLRAGNEIERFHDAISRAPAGWLDSLEESGFCLLVVGAGIGLQQPAASSIQQALRERRALVGFVESSL